MRYERTQTGCAMISILSVAALLVATGRFFHAPPAREISVIVSPLLLITIAAFYKLTIMIDTEVLRWSFGIGLINKKVPVAQIADCEPIRIRWWYGWGIHLTPYGWLYNLAAGKRWRSRCGMAGSSHWERTILRGSPLQFRPRFGEALHFHPGRTRVSRVGRGVAPRRTFLVTHAARVFQRKSKFANRGDAFANTRDA